MNLADALPPADSMVSSVVGEIALVAVLFVLRLVGFDVFAKSIRLCRMLGTSVISIAIRRRWCLVYTDCDDDGATTRRIAVALAEADQHGGTRYVPLNSAGELLEWPLTHRRVDSVVLLISDVSPLSTSPRARDRIQERLVQYVRGGGLLVLGHDALYRRTRNHVLQRLYGVTLTDFRPQRGKVTYLQNADLAASGRFAELFSELPERFDLDDREVVTGTWPYSTDLLYLTQAADDHRPVPLVTHQRIHRGHAVWVNSGDHDANGPSQSIGTPEPGFVLLLSSLLRHVRGATPVSRPQRPAVVAAAVEPVTDEMGGATGTLPQPRKPSRQGAVHL